MWKQTKNISHEHTVRSQRSSSCRNLTRIRSVTWQVKRATGKSSAQDWRPRLCRFKPETRQAGIAIHTHTHTRALSHTFAYTYIRVFACAAFNAPADASHRWRGSIFMMVANKSDRENTEESQAELCTVKAKHKAERQNSERGRERESEQAPVLIVSLGIFTYLFNWYFFFCPQFSPKNSLRPATFRVHTAHSALMCFHLNM